MPDQRKHFTDLLQQLIGDSASTPADATGAADTTTDEPAAIRLLAHALLNLADEHGPDTFEDLRHALPWLEASTLDDPAARLTDHPGLRALDKSTLHYHLESVSHTASPADHTSETLAKLAELDHRLADAADTDDPAEIRHTLLHNTSLLAATIGITDDNASPDHTTTAQHRLTDAIPAGHLSYDQRTHNRRALDVLAELEQGDPDSVLSQSDALGDHARRFEVSLADNAVDHRVIHAVRAALAFGQHAPRRARPTHDNPLDGILYNFDLFRREPELATMGHALIEMRGLVPGHIRGAIPLRRLRPWAEYLRGRVENFADAREISPREAVSWAHFCLHLTNVCDVVAQEGDLTDTIRQSIKSTEDELKEFSMAGRRETGTRRPADGMANLGRYDQMRWRPRGDVAYLADRTARLAGAWCHPFERTPMGSPPELTGDLYDSAESAWQQTLADQPQLARQLAESMQHCHIVGADWMESLHPEQIARLLAFGYGCARDLPGVNTNASFHLDFTKLDPGAEPDSGAQETNRPLEFLLERLSLPRMLDEDTNVPNHSMGLVGAFDTADDTHPTITVDLQLDGELRALIELLDNQSPDDPDPELRHHIHQRIDELTTTTANASSPNNAADPNQRPQTR